MHGCGWMVHPESRERLQTQGWGLVLQELHLETSNITLCIPSTASCDTDNVFGVNRNDHFDLAIPEGILPSAQTQRPFSILSLKSGDNQTTKQILCKYKYLYLEQLIIFFCSSLFKFSILAVMKEQKMQAMLGLLTVCDLYRWNL